MNPPRFELGISAESRQRHTTRPRVRVDGEVSPFLKVYQGQ